MLDRARNNALCLVQFGTILTFWLAAPDEKDSSGVFLFSQVQPQQTPQSWALCCLVLRVEATMLCRSFQRHQEIRHFCVSLCCFT
jgi:hypothetical protein